MSVSIYNVDAIHSAIAANYQLRFQYFQYDVEMAMSKKLVAYFSASGVIAKLASRLANAIGADLHEIQPESSCV